MQTTSHFVGVAIDGALFADLFVELQKYSVDHSLDSVIEFQNILSLHVTLYYLERLLPDAEKAEILKDISRLSADEKFTISKLRGKYFGEPGKERVSYIGCETKETFKAINTFFAEKYKYAEIPENQLAFVPHISLFRINDADAFVPHKTNIDSIIDAHVQAIDDTSLVTGLHLFQVNSMFHPEIQIPIV